MNSLDSDSLTITSSIDDCDEVAWEHGDEPKLEQVNLIPEDGKKCTRGKNQLPLLNTLMRGKVYIGFRTKNANKAIKNIVANSPSFRSFRTFRKHLYMYKSAISPSSSNNGYPSGGRQITRRQARNRRDKNYRKHVIDQLSYSWSPTVILVCFGLLIIVIGSLEVFMIHYAQKHGNKIVGPDAHPDWVMGARNGWLGNSFLRSQVVPKTYRSRLANLDYNRYFYYDGQDEGLEVDENRRLENRQAASDKGEGGNGEAMTSSLTKKLPQLHLGQDRVVGRKNVINYINYNFDPNSYQRVRMQSSQKEGLVLSPGAGLQLEELDKSKLTRNQDSRVFSDLNVKPRNKIPVFVGLEKHEGGDWKADASGKGLSDSLALNSEFPDHFESEDDLFEKAKKLLLLNNEIPKAFPKIGNIDDAGYKENIKNIFQNKYAVVGNIKNDSTGNVANRIYLHGTGQSKNNLIDSGSGNLGDILKERLVFSPFMRFPFSFDVLAMLPRGLKPSIYYNYLLLRQNFNTERFAKIFSQEAPALEKYCRFSGHLQTPEHCPQGRKIDLQSLSQNISNFIQEGDKFPNPLIPHRPTLNQCPSIPKPLSKLWNSNYKTVKIAPNATIYRGDGSWRVLEKELESIVLPGGIGKPSDCIARHKIAVIIPFRDRVDHLYELLKYLHPFLHHQELSYKIYVVEQHGGELFNKAILMNAGFKIAFTENDYHCYVFHDVDLIPENPFNLYSCSKQPKHLSVAIDEMDYKLKYQMLVGGVLMFRPEHFIKVNGYSGLYWGWGAEDDDMAFRIQHMNLHITRPPETIGRYRMIKHVKRKPIALHKRYKLLALGIQRIQIDGLNSVTYKIVNKTKKGLYTHILLDIGKPPTGY